jgi:cyclic pyranopterin phosphate synthase
VLIDGNGRRIDYLRVSVTDRCDLRCDYCMPPGFHGFGPANERLSAVAIERAVRAFVALGVRHVRLTGGEPLVRRDICDIASRLGALDGVDDLSLSTNGTRLAELAPGLAAAGVRRVNVSLDSLVPSRFAAITGGGSLGRVLVGLDAAVAAGIGPIKINTVVMRGINDDEIEAMVAFCAERGFTLRLIETMPVGGAGRAAMADRYLDLRDVRRRLERRYTLLPDVMPGAGPARYYRVVGSETRIGFITPLSMHFCDSCNRLRLAADGDLHLCLGRENRIPLAALLAEGDEAHITAAIRAAVARKPMRHDFQQRASDGQTVRYMALTGG